ncbi:MAG: glycerol-3-phosphate 1-O-acyltransferase PlsY [Gammaproteobacteria bacterium]|nr:glycerol-3-phosphate 1-O-acyltransferase PlsY [Gammaproteobacteria bacterium]
MSALIALAIAYLLGSVSCSILICKVLKKPDPRTAGSGNAGATNVLRLLGKKEAACVLVGDVLKGLIAVAIGQLLHVYGFMLGLVGLAAVVGHVFPLYFGFKGGKGVATAIGATLGLSLISGVLMAAAWVAVALVTRYSSLASLIAVILAPIFLIIFSHGAYFIPSVLIAALIIWKHKENIARLQSKTESKIAF